MENISLKMKLYLSLLVGYFMNFVWIENLMPFIGSLSLVNIFTIMCGVMIFIRMSKISEKLINKTELIMIGFVFGLLMIGLISSIYFQFQPIKIVIIDIFLFFRYIIMLFFVLYCLDDFERQYLRFVALNLIKIITVVNLLLLLTNLVINVFPILDIRYGIPSQQLWYSHPTYLGTTSFISILFYIINVEKFDIFVIINIILCIFSTRTKIIILILIFLISYFILKISWSKKDIRFHIIILTFTLILITVLLFKDTIYFKLFSSTSSARSILFKNALILATTLFPLGSGFATFASYLSFTNYSPTYLLLGMNYTYGFRPEKYKWGMDSYFSSVLGQFGFIGIFLFLGLITTIWIVLTNKMQEKNLNQVVPLHFFFSYVLISCVTENTLNSGVGVYIFLLFGCLYTSLKPLSSSC